MDCSVVPLGRHGLSLISTTDFFNPLVDDPYIQGQIGCANVLSDLYAMGIVHCDNMLMILSVSTKMTQEEKDIVTTQMIKGFNDKAREAETEIRGGQTVKNPWPIIGGVAMSTCSDDEFIDPIHGVPGDIIVLTKPLGTQIAGNMNEWIQKGKPNWEIAHEHISYSEVAEVFDLAQRGMTRLNLNAAKLMHKYGAHGATDVTGFGLLGHGTNLAKNQTEKVDFKINLMPLLHKMGVISDLFPFWHLTEGYSAETSGGLFVLLPSLEAAEKYCAEIEELDGHPAWIIGEVIPAADPENPKAFLSEDVTYADILY
eukprot:TRINITY_DN12725_c0_g1_i1.p1 TRINITY_DN12725_c0_g1~~TRINITY_DN12725_c0_g1_i1.p1  ORF type:complete len:313 (+),score=77.14 TRINITY_DN12725_c0_g1_i1:184-1122(+)